MPSALSRAATILALALLPTVAPAAPFLISGTGSLGSFTGTFDYDPSTSTVDVELTNTSALGGFNLSGVVPEPSVVLLLGLGLAGLRLARRGH